MRVRDLAVAGLVALLSAVVVSLPAARRLDDLSVDLLFLLRHAAYGPLHQPATSPTVVIAFDEETYRREPFVDTPRVMWTPHLALVLDAAAAAGAKVIGFDTIFPTSIEPFVRGYEREFLLTLRRLASDGRIVLGQVQHQHKPINPFRGYSFAAGHERNLRALNLFEDDDGVIRRVPLTLVTVSEDGLVQVQTAMAAELAARALARSADAMPAGRSNTLLVNFAGGAGEIPAYSLADLWACAKAGRAEYFRRHFQDRVVLVGAVLDVEDRKVTSKRYITAPEGLGLPERCAFPVMEELYREDLRRDSIPAVFVHAAAVNNLIRGDILASPPRWQSWALALVPAGFTAAATLGLAPAWAGVALGSVGALWAAAATMAFRHGLVLPLLPGLAAAGLAFPLLLAYRIAVSDRARRRIGRAFALYLPRAVVDRLIAQEQLPELGGVAREISVLFSDIVDFTRLSEAMRPETLVRDLNRYFAAMTAIVEAHGGFVDKFVGDAVVAVFGAPIEDADHAAKAVRAALAMQEWLRDGSQVLDLAGGGNLNLRIGVNTGEALVGNIGSPRRFNYTVMGDTVNLAARLESVNKRYGTALLVSDETARRAGGAIRFREIDTVRVIGRKRPVTLFQPLGEIETAAIDEDRRVAFAAALALWREGRFAAAHDAFAALAPRDAAAAVFAARAHAYAEAPPASWDGVADLTEK